ncbi:hypothetical protein [Streptomyces sp. MP131-18]|uniref:hypothetical protein n=1 Tax=Streptomyces sp. MP131-18 TaxID=1857892 RepID=UPI00097BB7B9|nr:hypothetical protein [Streptomyces sp. MP131-18]ONK10358.1 hypothetical protein STBA_10800 [Streptomyces sp. MP131-18]
MEVTPTSLRVESDYLAEMMGEETVSDTEPNTHIVTERAASMAVRGALSALIEDGRGRGYLDLQQWLTAELDHVYRQAGR